MKPDVSLRLSYLQASNLLALREAARECLVKHGSRLIEKATTEMSLRELSRRTKLSPTYLSHVRSKKSEISPEAYCRVFLVAFEGGDE